MSPLAFGYDGFRWHARAYCHIEGKIKDFLLPRILEVLSSGPGGADGKDDLHWQEHIAVEITPHPQLTDSQKKVVAKDYGMRDGKAILSVRTAMLFYVLKRLGLLRDPEEEKPRAQHIVLLNKDDVQSALGRAELHASGTAATDKAKPREDQPLQRPFRDHVFNVAIRVAYKDVCTVTE